MKQISVRRIDEHDEPLRGDNDGVDVELQPLTHPASDRPSASCGDRESKSKLLAEPSRLKFLAPCAKLSVLVVLVWLLMSAMSTSLTSTSTAVQVAVEKGFRVGVAGAAAMSVQVLLFLWARTIMNYQFRYGGSMVQVFMVLWREGGVFRLYQGLLVALVQAPLARFGDTAANEGTQSLLDASALTRDLPIGIKSIFCSVAAGLFRIVTMPIDTVKVKLQVEGPSAVAALMAKVVAHGPGCLFDGWLANQVAATVAHYPWFATRNYMRSVMDASVWGVYRDVAIGLCASLVSDVASNSARVLKTNIQTSDRPISYREAIASIVRADGVGGLFFRGLRIKILASAAQSVVFNVVWEQFQRMQLTGGVVGVAAHPVVGNRIV